MTTATATWGMGLGTSLAAHLAAAALLAAMLHPDPIPDQPQPKSHLTIETQEVTRSSAKSDAPQATNAAATRPQGAHLDQGQVPQSIAKTAKPRAENLTATTPPVTPAPPTAPPETKLAAAALPPPVKATPPALPAVKPLQPDATRITPDSANAPSITAVTPATTAVPPAPAAVPLAKAAIAPTTTLQASLADTPAAQPVQLTEAAARPQDLTTLASPIAPQTDPTQPQPPATPDTPTAQPSNPTNQPLAAAPTDGTHMTASLAWSGGATAQIDAQSLKAIQSFMRPGDTATASDDVHDGLSAILSAVPCSRLQAEFNPATGHLDLRGHVPDEAMRGPVLKALQAQLGSAIQVDDAMLILPRPQCGALSGISDVGLSQSQDQLTNPRLIGADAQARAYTYATGQVMILDLAAPDYDAYLYVDFFDADGNVIHLVPNDTVPLKLRAAKTAMRVGASDAGEPFLNITIGPPYGQEIAAAFAASAPLYDGLRPLSEPAGPYLDWLKGKVAAARAKSPDFKGEWVYFFVSTRQK